MLRTFLLLFVLSVMWLPASAQQSFHFLERPATPRALALGGAAITAVPGAGMWLQNPALLDSLSIGQLQLAYQWFYADVQQSNIAYAHHTKAGSWGAGLQYVDWGKMQGYDASGSPTSPFTASDYVVQLSHARRWRVYSAGASIKWASSGIAGYRAGALLLDAGGTFSHPSKELVAGFVVRNVGVFTRSYADGQSLVLPLEVRLGLTFKPKFMPFRFTLTGQHLQQPDLGKADPASLFNKEEPPLVDNVMRHLAIGTELLLSQNVQFRAGYNHLLRQELKLENISGMSGFSLGLLLRVKSFQLEYTRAWYHVAGGTSQLGLGINMNKIFKKRI
ncbi:type IX secretion system protein PorQ [Nafulsella turpanensis]|uniref:type IX secretion system protein PorQ n=1 Tax=Nafulsella turpanensis TaxID=1265690 RepID=UPI0003489A27|nr:type IX secretion system protein PorQ [Nafulsella turpanensis]